MPHGSQEIFDRLQAFQSRHFAAMEMKSYNLGMISNQVLSSPLEGLEGQGGSKVALPMWVSA